MKLLLAIAGLVAVCSGLPAVPSDTGRYVANVTRYVWMPDGEGAPRLVDLHEPVNQEALLKTRNGANNRYWLYTRQNRNTFQLLTNGNVNSVRNSNLNAAQPTYVLVHGWSNNGNSPMPTMIRNALLDVINCNVIVVDWNALANENYNTATSGVPGVGQNIGNFLRWLVANFDLRWNRIQIVGYSLGAHAAGIAGRTAGSSPRIVGLDPAGLGWFASSNRLNRNAGAYVEVIHTDGGAAGIFTQSGHADFYPNGGRNPQPGCILPTCSHARSFELFAATIRHRHLFGRLCNNMTQMENNWCSGNQFIMGTENLNKWAPGIYRLTTGRTFPF